MMKLTKRDYIIFVIMAFVSVLIIYYGAIWVKDTFCNDRIDQDIVELNGRIETLEKYIKDQELLNNSFNNRIHKNFINIDNNQEQIIQNMIDIDDKSIEGLMMLIEELQVDIDRLERK